jgi:SAM-dependent methyltransferase
MSPRTSDYIRYTMQTMRGTRSQAEREMADRRERDLSPYLDTTRPLRILDVANGRLRPQYALLKAAGHNITGIDLVNRPQESTTNRAYRVARWLYRWNLGLPAGSTDGKGLTCGNVGELPYRPNTFDLAVSAAAFEHFLDVPAVVAELHRVIRPGGLAWISIHLFASLSGGHNVTFSEVPMRRMPAGVEPWDHLRKRCLPFSVPLNEWRRDQYLSAFSERFEILSHYCALREGAEMLTPEIEAELAEYGRDELTCATVVIVARRA